MFLCQKIIYTISNIPFSVYFFRSTECLEKNNVHKCSLFFQTSTSCYSYFWSFFSSYREIFNRISCGSCSYFKANPVSFQNPLGYRDKQRCCWSGRIKQSLVGCHLGLTGAKQTAQSKSLLASLSKSIRFMPLKMKWSEAIAKRRVVGKIEFLRRKLSSFVL